MKNELKRTDRNSNFEILRIIAMVLIVGHHLAYHGGFAFEASKVTVNELWIQFLMLGGKVGSNIYILITGYYLINSDRNRKKSVLQIWLECLFYSVGILAVLSFWGIIEFGLKDILTSFFPIIFERWWFASSYVLLMILLPFTNKLLNMLEEKEYQRLLICLLLVWSLIPTFTGQFMQSSNLLWFICLYSIGGYIRKYNILRDWSYSRCLFVTIALYLATFATAVMFDFLGTKIAFFYEKALHFYDMQSITVVLISVFAVLSASRAKIFSVSWINLISASTFGVYLIHDNKFLRKIIWDNIFDISSYQDKGILIPYSIAVIVTLFILCVVIDLLRNKLFVFVSRLIQKNQQK